MKTCATRQIGAVIRGMALGVPEKIDMAAPEKTQGAWNIYTTHDRIEKG